MRIITRHKIRRLHWPLVGISYSYPDGGPVLKEHATLRNVNGFFFRSPGRHVVFVRFRRFD